MSLKFNEPGTYPLQKGNPCLLFSDVLMNLKESSDVKKVQEQLPIEFYSLQIYFEKQKQKTTVLLVCFRNVVKISN